MLQEMEINFTEVILSWTLKIKTSSRKFMCVTVRTLDLLCS